MDNTTNTTPVTLESIAQKKAMLLQEIRLQKEIMTGLTQEIFAPLEPATNKANAMMRAFNTGMAVFDGIVLGVKVMNFSASATTPADYVKNEEMTGELMTAKTIFRNEDGHLFRHLRYTYTYDSENRVTSKEAFKWDSVKEAWVPYFKLDVEYTDSEVELSYARWNSRTNGYDSYTQTTVYELNDSNAALMLASTK